MTEKFSDIIIAWYQANKRDLPWRETEDPFLIWISEIVLQQTRVAQGLDYFYRLTERFPDVKSLAEADNDELMKYWQGLGYYSRARNLHKAAQQIMEQHAGIFPHEHTDVLKLAGIGPYTAAAICSFAYNQPYAVVDGNVYRVLSRISGWDDPIDQPAGVKKFQQLANELLSQKHPGLHNQAIMEFGALQCTPSNPDCTICPLNSDCQALMQNKINSLPVKSGKIKVQQRFLNYFVFQFKNQLFIQKRTANDIWQNLWEFPLIESDHLLTNDEIIQHTDFQKWTKDIVKVDIQSISKSYKHLLTHRQIWAQFITIQISDVNPSLKDFKQIQSEDLQNFAIPRLIDRFLEEQSFF